MTVEVYDKRVHEALRTVQQFARWLDLCECGDGSAVVLAPVKAFLERFSRANDMFELDGDRAGDFWLYLLDVWKLTEHGGSVYGSWLTPAGKRLRAALRLVDLGTYSDDVGEDGSWWRRESLGVPAGGTVSCGVWEPGR